MSRYRPWGLAIQQIFTGTVFSPLWSHVEHSENSPSPNEALKRETQDKKGPGIKRHEPCLCPSLNEF